MQNQIDSSKYMQKDLEHCKNELSNIAQKNEEFYANYNSTISNIYSEIDGVKIVCKINTLEFHDFFDRNIHKDMVDIYYGRLYADYADISIGLYRGYDTFITDRNDSANIMFREYGVLIGDHNTQEFKKLFDVKIGSMAYINTRYLERIHLECVGVLNGYNLGTYIADENGVMAEGRADYLMYTCDGRGGVLITLWDVILVEDYGN